MPSQEFPNDCHSYDIKVNTSVTRSLFPVPIIAEPVSIVSSSHVYPEGVVVFAIISACPFANINCHSIDFHWAARCYLLITAVRLNDTNLIIGGQRAINLIVNNNLSWCGSRQGIMFNATRRGWAAVDTSVCSVVVAALECEPKSQD